MASNRRNHFVDPRHELLKTRYGREDPHTCDLCQVKLAGLVGYSCRPCNIDVHKACADSFAESISFFLHPPHPHGLRLSRIPSGPPRRCNLCRWPCRAGSFVYRCIECGFDVHPLCSILSERFPSPHPQHGLVMVSSESQSPGYCSACHQPLDACHYVCSCSSFRLHIACATNAPAGASQGGNGPAVVQGPNDPAGQRSYGPTGQGWCYGHAIPGYNNPAVQSSYYGHVIPGYNPAIYGPVPGNYNDATGSGESFLTAIAKFLLKTGVHVAISEVLSAALSEAFNNN